MTPRGWVSRLATRRSLCVMQPATSRSPERAYKGRFLRGLGQRAGHAQTNRPLCRSTSLGRQAHAWSLCPAIEGRASAVWLIGMPGKSPAPGGGPACSPAEVASLKDSWSSGQGIRLDIWRFGAGSSLLLLCWVTLSSLLGLSVLHLLLAFSPVWQGFLEGMLMEWFREAWMLQGLTLSHSCHARGGWGHLEPSCWKCLKNFPDTPA